MKRRSSATVKRELIRVPALEKAKLEQQEEKKKKKKKKRKETSTTEENETKTDKKEEENQIKEEENQNPPKDEEPKEPKEQSEPISETSQNIQEEKQEEKQEELSEKEKKYQRRLLDRKHAFEEIISSEKIYFSNLQFVYWSVITTLDNEIKNGSQIISQAEIRSIFSNWQSLMAFNKELLKSLEKRKDIPIQERMIGDTFLELSSLMKMYTDFVNNFEVSNSVAAQCLERPEFDQLIKVS